MIIDILSANGINKKDRLEFLENLFLSTIAFNILVPAISQESIRRKLHQFCVKYRNASQREQKEKVLEEADEDIRMGDFILLGDEND